MLDGNYLLAGKALGVGVEVLSGRAANAEEITQPPGFLEHAGLAPFLKAPTRQTAGAKSGAVQDI